MDEPLITIQEGDIILKKGSELSELDLEKFGEFLELTADDRDLHPKEFL